MASQKHVWNKIAKQWKNFRTKPQEYVERFTEDKEGLILDVGCGSGRNLIEGYNYVATDFSVEMLRYAKEKAKFKEINSMFVLCDSAFLPFKENIFDSSIYYASLHNVKEKDKAINDLKYVLKNKAEILISVWNKWQPKFMFAPKEIYVSWTVNGKKLERYYYLFTKRSLTKFLNQHQLKIKFIKGSKRRVKVIFHRDLIAVAQVNKGPIDNP